MKKSRVYILTLILFAVAVVFIILKYHKNERDRSSIDYELKERSGSSAMAREWAISRNNATALKQQIKKNPENLKSTIALAALFIQEARVTGDHAYYDLAAMKYIGEALKKDSNNFEALTLKSLVQLSQHHFADGLITAQHAQKINPYNAFVYGIMVDGNVEMGNYTMAVENSDKMISIRPDIRSYSRIAYLREIHGD